MGKGYLATVSLLLCLVVSTATAQCCGDCNSSGEVTIDEILTTVDNALVGCSIVSTPGSTAAPAPTPTALPDQCATDAPGTRFTVLGTTYVVVEVEVIVEEAPDTYLLRYPVPLDAAGNLGGFQGIVNPIYLQKTCNPVAHPCAASGDQLGSVCGFSEVLNTSVSVISTYNEISPSTSMWGFSISPSSFSVVPVRITVDAAHVPLRVPFVTNSVRASVDVPTVGSFGYSFAAANYPEPATTRIAQFRAELLSLFAHVSLRKATLPTPPVFPQ